MVPKKLPLIPGRRWFLSRKGEYDHEGFEYVRTVYLYSIKTSYCQSNLNYD
jgi:hypothetical protein